MEEKTTYTVEDIIKDLMSKRCVSMHDTTKRCYGKGCDGQCAFFQIAMGKLALTEAMDCVTKLQNM